MTYTCKLNNELISPKNVSKDEWWKWYKNYLTTQHWVNVRANILKRDNYSCRMCNSQKTSDNPLQVHHSSYKYLGSELKNDHCIITLCKNCHDIFHQNKKIIKYDTSYEYKMYKYKGMLCYKDNRYEDSIALYKKAININSNSNFIDWFLLGNSLNKLEYYDHAILAYDKGLSINNNSYIGWKLRGMSLQQSGCLSEAIMSYNNAIFIDCEKYDVWYKKGNCLRDLKQYEESIKCYYKSILIKDDYYFSWFYMGHSLFKLRHDSNASKCYDVALSIKSGNYKKNSKLLSKLV